MIWSFLKDLILVKNAWNFKNKYICNEKRFLEKQLSWSACWVIELDTFGILKKLAKQVISQKKDV